MTRAFPFTSFFPTSVQYAAALALGVGALPLASSALAGEGPDVIVGDLTGPRNWSAPPIGTGPIDGIVRYSVGTTSCNNGTEPLDWYDFDTPDPVLHPPTQHPIITQNLYRLKDGRFEHLGQSWLKHGFCALQQMLCDTCPTPFCGACCHELGVGCSDPYSPSLNGNPLRLGPKSQIDPARGKIMVWPFPAPATTNNAVNNNGQLHVNVVDLDPALNAGALYFIESQYVAEDDTTAGNAMNNASWRKVVVGNSSGFPLTFDGFTQQEAPAILAWQDNDPAVTIVPIDIPNDGRMILGFKVTDNGDGTWHYEYAVFNFNSDRAGRSLSVPVNGCVNITNIGFHDVHYHSGDGAKIGTNYDGSDWATTRSNGAVTWSTAAFPADDNANALRWATLYNFRFDADAPPAAADLTLGLYKPGKAGDPVAMAIAALGPLGPVPVTCATDISPVGCGDGMVNVNDLLLVIGNWGATGENVADINNDNVVNVNDLLMVIGTWGPCA